MLSTNHNKLILKVIIIAFCVVSFAYIFVYPLYAGPNPVRTFKDFEQSLCEISIAQKESWKHGHCPQHGIVTAMQGGRLGNQMWEYASVWALARRTGLEPYVPKCLRLELDTIFDSLTLPTFEEIGHCPVKIEKFASSLNEWNDTTQGIILPKYHFQSESVLMWTRDIIQEFSFKKELLDKSQDILHLAAENLTTSVFVGVHVRRTDYIGYLMTKYSATAANASFYIQAMQYFESMHTNVVFMVVSDDPTWCKETFSQKKNVYLVSKNHRNSPELDLAILASCNHTIFDYGTFGEWGAILAGGETMYYDLSTNRHTSGRLGVLRHSWYNL